MLALVFVFLICFAGIVITAYWSIESIKAVAERFRLSDTFVGAVFLSVGTSFPEFINSIISGFNDQYLGTTQPLNGMRSFYNVTGANVGQIVFLVSFLAVIASIAAAKGNQNDIDRIVNIFGRDSIVSGTIVFWETIFLTIAFTFPFLINPFLFKGFNVVNLLLVFAWAWYLRGTYNTQPFSRTPEQSKYFRNGKKNHLIVITAALGILFGALAYVNFYISGQFDIAGSTAFGVILSFVTSSPEFSALFFLFKQREFKMAVGGFFGSSLFNLTLPAYTNFISSNPILGQEIYITQTQGQGYKSEQLASWLSLNIVLLILFLLSFYKNRRGRIAIMISNALMVLTTYSLFIYFSENS